MILIPRHRLSPQERAAFAGALLHASLAGRLPPLVPHEPLGMAAFHAAAREAPAVLDALARLYGVEQWTYAQYRRAVLEGALGAWRPGSRIVDRPDGAEVVSEVCPLGAEAERDPRACHLCRAFQEMLVRTALPGQVESVMFSETIARGDAACHQRIRLRGPASGEGALHR